MLGREHLKYHEGLMEIVRRAVDMSCLYFGRQSKAHIQDVVSEFGVLKKSPFIDPSVVHKIHSTLTSKSTSHFVVDSISAYVHVYAAKKHKQYFIDFMFFYTYMLLEMLNMLRPQQKTLTISIYLTSCKKQFPSNQQPLRAKHVNSGVTHTYAYRNHADVIVFREEEVFKVLLHELIHALQIDNIHMQPHIEQPIQNFFNAKKPLIINESYTDTLACFLNVCIYSYMLSLMDSNMSYKKHVHVHFQEERNHILEQAARVWNHIQHNAYVHVPYAKTKVYEEHTRVISYYILKAINFYHIQAWLGFAGAQAYVLRDSEGYVAHLLHHLQSSKLWKLLNQKTKTPTPSSSLRMSKIDICNLLNTRKDKLLKTMILS